MKKFIAVIILFAVPIALIYGVFGLVLINSGELKPLEEVVSATLDGSLKLYGSAYHESFQTYKYSVAKEKKAEVMVLGTSRSMQISSEFFDNESFYNCGGATRDIYDYKRFIELLPEDALPKKLLIVLDQNMFSEVWARDNATGEIELKTPDIKKDVLLKVGSSYGDKKFKIRENLKPQDGVYGLAAAGRGSGFAADGSYRYGSVAGNNLENPESNFQDTYRMIDFGTERFIYGDTVSPLAIKELTEFLEVCKAKEIKVTAIIPPFAPEVYEKMLATGQYGYVTKMYETLVPIFTDMGGEIFDYTYIEDSEAVEYIDGFHGGDVVYAEIMLEIAEKSLHLKEELASDKINKLLAEKNGNPRVLILDKCL